MPKLTPEIRKALQDTLYHRLKMWDASVRAEELMNAQSYVAEIDTGCSGFIDLAVEVDDAEDAYSVSDRHLIEAFDLEEVYEP